MRLSLSGASFRSARLRLLAAVSAAALGAGLLATVAPAAQAAVFTPNNPASITVAPGATLATVAHQTGAGSLTEDVNIALSGLTASDPSSLTITLTGPNGTAVNLVAPGTCTTPLTSATLTFDQQAATSITRCNGSGSYVPVSSLGLLNRISPWGNWTLSITNASTTATATLSGGFTVTTSTSAFQNLIPATDNSGPAKLYPTNFTLKARQGTVTDVSLVLKGVSDSAPGDIDALLVSPAGTAVWLMSDACEGTAVTNVSWTFSDQGAATLPATGACGNGTYKPVNYDGGDADALVGPAPAGANATTMSAFDGAGANGTWTLWIMDDNPNGGSDGGGGFTQSQSLSVATTGNPVPVTATPANVDSVAPQTKLTHRPKRKTHGRHGHFTFVSSEPGSTFQCKLDNKAWKSCSSALKVKKPLRVHRHRFKVRAIDSAGNVDPSPAIVRWRVLARHLPPHHRPDTHQS